MNMAAGHSSPQCPEGSRSVGQWVDRQITHTCASCGAPLIRLRASRALRLRPMPSKGRKLTSGPRDQSADDLAHLAQPCLGRQTARSRALGDGIARQAGSCGKLGLGDPQPSGQAGGRYAVLANNFAQKCSYQSRLMANPSNNASFDTRTRSSTCVWAIRRRSNGSL